MILTTSDPVCIARDPASLEPEWSELARRRAYPTVFLTPDWIGLARRHDRRGERLVTAPRMELPGSFDAYVQGLGKKERHELRRKLRRLETGRRVAFRFGEEGERAAVTDRFVALHRRSRGEKAEFMTPDTERFFRDVADTLAARGWLRLGVLSVDGEDAAVLFGFAYEGTLALYNAAYDPNLAPLSVGIACTAYAIRSAIAEGLRTYDFLRGAEPYKYDLGGTDHWLLRFEASRL